MRESLPLAEPDNRGHIGASRLLPARAWVLRTARNSMASWKGAVMPSRVRSPYRIWKGEARAMFSFWLKGAENSGAMAWQNKRRRAAKHREDSLRARDIVPE